MADAAPGMLSPDRLSRVMDALSACLACFKNSSIKLIFNFPEGF